MRFPQPRSVSNKDDHNTKGERVDVLVYTLFMFVNALLSGICLRVT
jgi:hypothetical protein